MNAFLIQLERSLCTVNDIFRAGKGDAAADLHIYNAAVFSVENDCQMILTVARRDNMLQIAVQAGNRTFEKAQGLINDMGAPIEQLAAAIFTQGLPIVPAALAVAGDVNFVNITQLP